MNAALAVLLCIPFSLWSGVRLIKAITYGIDIGGHLKRAADANTVDLAAQEMKIVILQLESRQMTRGYTSVLYQTPDEDVEFWYTNLKQSLDELERCPSNASQLEKSNVLMKLRETLLDSGKNGVHVTDPDGISVFPYNAIFAFWGWASVCFVLGGCFFLLRELNE